jgi:ABC-type branched-subunit amino acid transport system ATPase component
MLAARRIVKAYGGRQVLDNVSIEVPEGCVTALVGINGSGKSTLLDILSGLVPADSGEIVIDQTREISRLSAVDRARMGIARVFQHGGLPNSLEARQVVWLSALSSYRWRLGKEPIADSRRGRSRSQVWTQALQLCGTTPGSSDPWANIAQSSMTAVGLETVALSMESGDLSGGQQRKLGFAAVLAREANIWLLDEPTATLDETSIKIVCAQIRNAARVKGRGVLLAEHNLEAVAQIADVVCWLVDGRIATTGTPGAVLQSDAFRRGYIGSM